MISLDDTFDVVVLRYQNIPQFDPTTGLLIMEQQLNPHSHK